jgi:hypothetical protein
MYTMPKLVVLVDKDRNGRLRTLEMTPEQFDKYVKTKNAHDK